MLIDPYPSLCTKLKSKQIKDLSINPAPLIITEEKEGSSPEYMGTGDHYLNITTITQTVRATMNKWDLLKLRHFCKAKDTVTKTKW